MPDVPNVPCSECKSHFPDLFSFRVHFQVSHQNVNTYACVLEKCDRKFRSYYPFRKHVNSIHHVPFVASQSRQKPHVVLNVNDQSSECILEVDSSVGNSENDSDLYCDVEDLLIQEQDYLVAKLYSNPALPRSVVSDMVNNFSKYLSSPFFENMNSVITSSLDPNLSSSTRQEIDEMFELIMNPFAHLQTEYKRLKYFETNGEKLLENLFLYASYVLSFFICHMLLKIHCLTYKV